MEKGIKRKESEFDDLGVFLKGDSRRWESVEFLSLVKVRIPALLLKKL